jgi:methylphosphotriester-DNA--protein-cysteine methyltransferase
MLELLDAAEQWWRQFRGLALKGRPPGTGTWTDRAHFLHAVEQAMVSIRSSGEKVTEEKVADLLRTDDRTLRRWFKDFGTTWKKMRNG